MKTLNERIRDLREDHDIKQYTVAKLLGISQQQYSNYEKGESEFPSRYINAIADFYRVSADYLYGRTDCPDGVNKYDENLTDDYSVDELVGDVLSLSPNARDAVREYVRLWKENESRR